MMYTRENLIADLKRNVCEIHFTKVNGANRVMRCTLMDRFLPLKELREDHVQRPDNPEVIAVWDVHANNNEGDWRAFRIDSVVYAQVVDAY
jgi:hypothetical protein